MNSPPVRPALLLVLVALLMAFGAIGARGIWETDEARYTSIGARMAASGDWLTPRLNFDDPHLTKPPVTYWLAGAAVAVFGPQEWAVRLPHALAFLSSIWLVWRLASRLTPARPWLAPLVFATAPYAALGAGVVTPDFLLATAELLAVWCFVEAWQDPARRARWLIGMWLAFALAMLIKGPPGLLPLIALVWASRAIPDAPPLRALFAPLGVSLFLGVGLSWYLVMIARDPALLGHFLGHEVVARIATDAHGRNSEWYAPFTVYLPTLLFGLLPWVLWRPSWARVLPDLPRPTWWRARWMESPLLALLAAWVVTSLLVFCLAQSRQWSYLLPLMAPLALLLGHWLAPHLDLARRRVRGLIALSLMLPLVLQWGVAAWPHYKDSRALARALSAQTDLAGIERVVFDGHWPYWGLAFYFPVTVGELEAPGTPRASLGVSLRTDRCAEAARARRDLWVAYPKDVARVSAALSACDPALRVARVAHYRDMVFLSVTR
jgi:4-amino-4-deoxy-L-arabinose transferase-like glycosyltransferase